MAGAITAVIVIMFYVVFFVLFGWMWWRIMRKTGYSPWLGILMLVPIANIVMLAILAFRDWPIHAALKDKPEVKIPAALPKAATVVITLAVVLPVLMLLAAIAIPNLLRARIAANDTQAQINLQLISKAAEAYADAHNGTYPSDEYTLVNTTPPLLSSTYNNKTLNGYTYSLDFTSTGYQLTAMPLQCGVSGSNALIMETKGVLSHKECK